MTTKLFIYMCTGWLLLFITEEHIIQNKKVVDFNFEFRITLTLHFNLTSHIKWTISVHIKCTISDLVYSQGTDRKKIGMHPCKAV